MISPGETLRNEPKRKERASGNGTKMVGGIAREGAGCLHVIKVFLQNGRPVGWWRAASIQPSIQEGKEGEDRLTAAQRRSWPQAEE
jgi:hypothetical protein